MSRKCEPSRLRQAERPGNVDQRRAGLGREAAAPVRPGDPIAHLDRAGRPPAEPARADQLRRAAVRSKISSDGSTGSRGAGEKRLGVAHAIGPRRGRRLRTIASSAIAAASAGASSGNPGLSSSLGVLANIVLLLVGRLAAADDSFGRRCNSRKKGETPSGGFPFSLLVSISQDLVRAAPCGNGPFLTVPMLSLP